MEAKIVYFEKSGDVNTNEVLNIAKQRAEELGIKTIVLASTTGKTGVKAVEICRGMNVVVVGYATGFMRYPPNVNPFTDENRRIIESKGGKIINATHALAGISTAARNQFNGFGLGEVIAHTLRMFGPGIKVACEVAAMAADAALARTDEDVIAMGGTGREGGGCDAAVVLTPANVHNFFELRVKEILCKPLTSPVPPKREAPRPK
ncbi:MAG: hypothetical protein JRI86_08400 [Deltaproteobacteria bacterium]|nr:hypothetical protein [Deltaproteobacteria bacterium]